MTQLLTAALLLAAPPDVPGATPVPELIERLGSRDYRVRVAAGRELEGHGEAALSELRQAREHPSPEVRRRAGVLADRISRIELLKPRRVTLRLKDEPVKDAVAAIAAQTGYPLQVNLGDDEKRVSLDLTDATYWEAIDRLCLEGGLSFQSDYGDGNALLQESESYDPYVCRNGPFRLSLVSIDASRSIQLSQVPRNGDSSFNQSPENLFIHMGVFGERKAPLLELGQPTVTEAVDENGSSLIPTAETEEFGHQSFYPGMMEFSFEMSTHLLLHRRTRTGRTLKVLKGTIPVTVLAEKRADIEVPKLADFKKGEYAGRTGTVRLERVMSDDKIFTLSITATADDEAAYFYGNDLSHRFAVLDDEGRPYRMQISEMEHGGNFIRMTAQYTAPESEKLGPPAKFVAYRWIKTTQVVPFEFRDVPLP